jgi:hypothetical protein
MAGVKIYDLLAAYAHHAWAGWMQYMFSKSQLLPDGSVVIPPDLVQRWTRQANTLYADLPDQEKWSDISEAKKIMQIITENKWYYEEEKNKMRMDIRVVVNVPSMTPDQRLGFIEKVMEAFRENFPEAERVLSPDAPQPVTVSFWNDDGTPMDLSRKEEE